MKSPLEIARRSARMLAESVHSFTLDPDNGDLNAIPDDMSFREWCEALGARGMKVDRKPFRLDNRPALVPIYDAIPMTRGEAFQRRVIVQKATQLGITVWEVLADLYMAKKWGPLNIGLFLPDQSTASFKSEHRFMPVVRSAPELYRQLTHRLDQDGNAIRVGEGNVLTRQFVQSLLLFLWTSGRVTTESRPMDVVSLDEVQGMTLADIDRCLARMGDSDVQFALMLSTAYMPELDINFWYLQGSQEVWHTECESCGALSDLSDPVSVFPDHSIGYNTGQFPGAPPNEYVWTCPVCNGWIRDAQRGRYVAQNPHADPRVRSFLLPRTISPRITPRDMIESWRRSKTGDQRQSFYNRTLARPYIDADQLPVTLAHCEAAVVEGRRLGLRWESTGKGCYMGVDQMGGWCAVIIKRRLPDGRQAVVHVEAIFDSDPFARLDPLMRAYGVAICVVEQLPNVNDARRFANRWPGRVFLAGYADLRDDMIVWGDQISKSDRRTTAEDRSRYSVTLSQYKAMQMALFRLRNCACLFPDPDAIDADVLDDGRPRRIKLIRDWVFLHFTRTALVVEHDEETRKPRAKVQKVGIDPHYSFANMLCDVAWSREQGTGTMILPEATPTTDLAEKVERSMPGLPKEVIAMMDTAIIGTCGRCSAYEERGWCSERGFGVQRDDPGCPLYVRK